MSAHQIHSNTAILSGWRVILAARVIVVCVLVSLSQVHAQVNWVKVAFASNSSPVKRCCSGMAFDTATQSTVLFGGFEVGAYYSDTWTWDGIT